MASRKGIPNKVTATVKENMLAVFNKLGGTPAMAKWAAANETEFYKMYGRLAPTDLHISNPAGGPVVTTIQIVAGSNTDTA